MKKKSSIIWGLVLIAAGVLFALNALELVTVNLFFDGWWTLFIIIPCAIGVFTERDKTFNLIGVLVGVLLLLDRQGFIDVDLWKLLVPGIVVIIGVGMLLRGLGRDKSEQLVRELKESGGEMKNGCAVFSGQNLNFDGEPFTGAELTAVFGGVKCDLRGALITQDCVIEASAIFGGVDILLPADVNVKINSTALFGGVSDKTRVAHKDGAVTVYVNGTAMFGGVDIK